MQITPYNPAFPNNMARAYTVLAPTSNTLPLGALDPRTGFLQMQPEQVKQFVAGGWQSVAPLNQLLRTSNNRVQIALGLYLAQQLAANRTPGLLSVYQTTSQRFHNTRDPLIQTYLAGFYRYLKEPSAFGPMLKMLVANPQGSQQNIDANEEVGGALLELLSDQIAKKLSPKA